MIFIIKYQNNQKHHYKNKISLIKLYYLDSMIIDRIYWC